MKLTAQDLITLTPIIQAEEAGKTIQYNSRPGHIEWPWIDLGGEHQCGAFELASRDGVACLRIKPQPKLRAWRNPTEVPAGAFYREKGATWAGSLILGFWPGGVEMLWDFPNLKQVTWAELFREGEYSTDGFETVHPCGVMEDQGQ